MIGTAVVDAALELGEFDFSTAERWHVLVLHRGKPAARVDLPSPGVVSDGALAEAVLVRRADAERSRAELIERLRQRMGAPPTPCEPLRVSVVVCTHRRSQFLPALLDSLGRLDPAPFEAIVVDNDPGAEDCRARVEAAGFRYLREDRRGLDNARNAGIRAARGDVVAFTDDDCVLSPGWLGPLSRAFAHEGVVAATGPAFPYRLDTPARVRMEHQASLARGFRRISFDWRVISPLHAAAMGVGANMAIRRSHLLELGPEPFPPELDAGTETESGGDTYLLSRLLACGGRVVYEPEMFIFHQHRPDGSALRRAVLGYGIGLSASLTKLVVEDRELTAPRAWAWLLKQYLRTQRRRAVGRADAVETRLAWDYLRGGFLGTARWREALRTQRLAARSNGSAVPPPPGKGALGAGEPATASGPPSAGPPAVSVIVPTYRREETLRRALAALAAQDVAPGVFEVIVVDDDPRGWVGRVEADALARHPFGLRRVRNRGQGAAAARNQGALEATAPLLLFLDDDVVADTHLVRRHLEGQEQGQGRGAVVGAYRPRPTRTSLSATVACLWWQDFFALLDAAGSMTFVGALTANVSIDRDLFEAVGGFSEEYSRARREDWEWGLRLRRAGVPIVFDREASGRHEFTLGTAQRLRDARREGFGDTLIAAGYPEALPSLPLPSLRPATPSSPLRWAGFWLWRRASVRRVVVGALDLLELANVREAWARLFRLAQSASYAHGALDGGWEPAAASAAGETEPTEMELLSDAAIEPPLVAAPVVRVTLGGDEVVRVFPAEGVWAPSLAEQIVDAMDPEDVARAAAGSQADRRAPAGRAEEVEVIFGPANPESDLSHRDELEELGAVVKVASGDGPSRHWQAIAAAARQGDRPLVAVALPGTRPETVWLADALSAFSGERVGLALGGAVAATDPPEPLYLHDRQSGSASIALMGQGPAYLVLRRELLPCLGSLDGVFDPVIAAVEHALDGDWVIGHRQARGLRRPDHSARELGEAFGRAEARSLSRLRGPARRRSTVKGAARGGLTLGWLLLKQRGRLAAQQRELARGIAAGALSGLRR